MKFITTLILIFPIVIFTQVNIEKTAARINSVQVAKNYIKNIKDKEKAVLKTFSKSEDNNPFIQSLFDLKTGTSKIVDSKNGKILYKVLKTETVALYNINIMEFDSNKTPISEINSLKSFIIKGLKNKEHKFSNLARVYSSHSSSKTGGNLNWTNLDAFSKRFKKTVTEKHVGQVFSFDEHRQRKHYIIEKVLENKSIEQITVFIISKK